MDVSKEFVPYLDVFKTHPMSLPEGAWEKSLLARTGGRGWPHAVFMDDAGEVIGQANFFASDVESEFKNGLKEAQEFVRLRAAAAANPDDMGINFQYQLKCLAARMSADAYEKLKAMTAGGKVPKDLMSEFSVLEPVYLFSSLMSAAEEEAAKIGQDRKKFDALVAKLRTDTYALYKQGHLFNDRDHQSYPSYWNFVGREAHAQKDEKGVSTAISRMDAWLQGNKDNPRAVAFVKELKADIGAAGKPADKK